MKIFPAIDLCGGQAVRLYKGDYERMTVYYREPLDAAHLFESQGAEYLHIVDLEGAKDGSTANLEAVKRIVKHSGLFTELGGGVRSMETAEKYLGAGVGRVILGTAAVTDEGFLREALAEYGEKIAVGADIKDGFVAIRGWLESSGLSCEAFFEKMSALGVKTLICTDVSRDGAMRGTNLQLYRDLSARFPVDIVASGGVSTLDDVRALAEMGLYGAIIGKALYTGAISLSEAIGAAK